jgi:hypothetical protein
MSESTPEATATDPQTAAPAAPETPAPEAPAAPKPTETVDFWKAKAREQEKRAKDNADAARRLGEIEDAQKSAEQRATEATARLQQEAADARAETLRYKAAATHKIDPDYFDLLGSGDEETIGGRAALIGDLLAARNERDKLKADIESLQQSRPAPATSRPTPNLQPGATPVQVTTDDDSYPAHWVTPTRTD